MELQSAGGAARDSRQRKVHWNTRRGKAPMKISVADTPVERACRLLFPWHGDRYPGILRGTIELLKNSPRDTIKDWRRGRRTMPQWARDILIAELEKKTAAFSAAVSQLKNK